MVKMLEPALNPLCCVVHSQVAISPKTNEYKCKGSGHVHGGDMGEAEEMGQVTRVQEGLAIIQVHQLS